jgi:hypothetical protein
MTRATAMVAMPIKTRAKEMKAMVMKAMAMRTTTTMTKVTGSMGTY